MRGLLALLAGVALAAAGYVVAAAPSALLADGTTHQHRRVHRHDDAFHHDDRSDDEHRHDHDDDEHATTTTTTTTSTARDDGACHHGHDDNHDHLHAEAAEAAAPAYVVVQPAVIPTAATVGTTLTYSVALKNTGETGSGMTVVNTLSANVALIAADADQSGSCSGAAPQVTCSWDCPRPEPGRQRHYRRQVIQPGDVTTTVDARASDPAATVESRPAPPPVTAVQGIPIRFVAPGH